VPDGSDHEQTTRRFYEQLWNQRDRSVIPDWIDPGYVGHLTRRTEPVIGVDGFTEFADELLAALPDLTVVLEDVVASGDRVASRIRLTGTHLGPIDGYAPSGARVDTTYLAIERYGPDGRCVEEWVHSDDLGIARQIGALPAAGGRAERAAKALHRLSAPLLRRRNR
jgi:predicted ester cyclase